MVAIYVIVQIIETTYLNQEQKIEGTFEEEEKRIKNDFAVLKLITTYQK